MSNVAARIVNVISVLSGGGNTMINKTRIDELGIKPESIRKFVNQIEEQEINIKELEKWQRKKTTKPSRRNNYGTKQTGNRTYR